MAAWKHVSGWDGPVLPSPTDETKVFTAEDVENAYRRGFHHGAAAAAEGVVQGYSQGEISRWLIRVFRWRRSNRKDRVKHPEWLARE